MYILKRALASWKGEEDDAAKGCLGRGEEVVGFQYAPLVQRELQCLQSLQSSLNDHLKHMLQVLATC